MSRPELINKLKKKYPQLNKSQLEIIIDTFFKSIEKAFKENKAVELRGFGTFFVKEIKEKYIDFAGASAFMEIGDHPDSSGIVDRVRYKSQRIRQNDDKVKQFGKELKKRAKKKVVGGLEKFL